MENRRKQVKCKQCGFVSGWCGCVRCIAVAARQFCSTGCEQGYAEEKTWRIRRATLKNAVNN